MKTKLLIVAFCMIVILAGCARTSNSSAEQNQSADTQATSTEQPTSSSAEQSAQPELLSVPDAPDPKPLGWKQFDSFFQQLLVVHQHLMTDSVPEADLKTLVDRSQELHQDKSKDHEPSAPMRQMLADRTGQLSLEGKVKGQEIPQLEMYRQVLMATRDVVQMAAMEKAQGYPEKIERMFRELENRLIQVRQVHN